MAERVIMEGPSALPVEGETKINVQSNLLENTILKTDAQENAGMTEYKETRGLCE